MNAQKHKAKRAERRRYRVRKVIYGTPAKPRLSVFRSNLHISAQLIDDLNGVTLASATSQGKNAGLQHGGNVKAADRGRQEARRGGQGEGHHEARVRPRAVPVPRPHHGARAVAATEAGLVCTDLESMKAKMAEGRPSGPRRDEGSQAEGREEGSQAEGRVSMKEKKKPEGDKK